MHNRDDSSTICLDTALLCMDVRIMEGASAASSWLSCHHCDPRGTLPYFRSHISRDSTAANSCEKVGYSSCATGSHSRRTRFSVC